MRGQVSRMQVLSRGHLELESGMNSTLKIVQNGRAKLILSWGLEVTLDTYALCRGRLYIWYVRAPRKWQLHVIGMLIDPVSGTCSQRRELSDANLLRTERVRFIQSQEMGCAVGASNIS
jgi:hypothetical protein